MDYEREGGAVSVNEESTSVVFRDKEGKPLNELVIEFRPSNIPDLLQLVFSMQRVTERNKAPDVIDHHTRVVLEALADTIQMTFAVDPNDPPVNMFEDVVKFHEKFDLEYHGKPRNLHGVLDDVGQDLGDFRMKFDREESDEYEDEQVALDVAVEDGDQEEIILRLHKQLDALLDGVYVKLGTAYLQFGAPIVREGWRRIQAANMAKKRATHPSQSKRGSTFDVIKPQDWKEPDHRDLMVENAHVPALRLVED